MAIDMGRTGCESAPDIHGALRERLAFMRADLIERLVTKGIDAGYLSLLGSVGAALTALDAMPKAELGSIVALGDD